VSFVIPILGGTGALACCVSSVWLPFCAGWPLEDYACSPSARQFVHPELGDFSLKFSLLDLLCSIKMSNRAASCRMWLFITYGWSWVCRGWIFTSNALRGNEVHSLSLNSLSSSFLRIYPYAFYLGRRRFPFLRF